MGLYENLRREMRNGNSLNNPAMSLSSPAVWSWIMGGEPTAAGEEVNHFTAMQSVAVYACVRVITESIASLPFKLYERTSKGRLEATDVPLYALLTAEPNSEMSAFTFWETMTGCLALTGNCYAQIIRTKGGQIDSLYPLHPLKTEPYRRADGVLSFRTTDGESNGHWRDIPASDMFHVPLFSFDGLKGLSPIMQARQAIGLARASEKFGARFFGNGSRPGGVMSTTSTLDEKSQQNLRESWERSQSGTNQGKTAFLFGDWKYEQIGLSPEESQFLATRQFQRAEIAALFRVPPHMIGDTSRLSNSNHEQQSLSFVTDTLRPYLSRIEAEIVRKLLPSQGRNSGCYVVQADVSERLRGDFATTMAGYSTGRQWGWFSANDVRKDLGENPGGPELDVYLVPVNMQDAKRLLDTESIQDQPIGGAQPQNEATPTEEDRSLLNQFARASISVFRDGIGRLAKRNKRDSEAISSIFRPVLRSIANLSIEHNGLPVAGSPDPADAVIGDVLKAIEKRISKWPEQINEADLDAIAQGEFLKAIRSLHINITREIAAAKAEASLTPEFVDA